jgi:hypothetical protein
MKGCILDTTHRQWLPNVSGARGKVNFAAPLHSKAPILNERANEETIVQQWRSQDSIIGAVWRTRLSEPIYWVRA